MKFGVKSDKGIQRDSNEDSYNIIAGYPNVPVCFIIADGMGGHNSGEVASKMAVDSISNYILEFPDDLSDETRVEERIQDAIINANTEIFEISKLKPETAGMGTTLILAVVCNKKIYIGHVGDSRVYLLRDGNFEQITTDHSFIEELVKTGSITRLEAQGHPKRNLITRALGCLEKVESDLYDCNIKDNDVYLLCTDGLTNMLDDEKIKEILENTDDPQQACNTLVDAANAAGGEDNVSVIIFRNQ